jgi:hypothetical protein
LEGKILLQDELPSPIFDDTQIRVGRRFHSTRLCESSGCL